MKKKILIVSTKDPFTKGGDSILIDSLAQELSKYFETEKIYIPFCTSPELIEEQIEGIRKLKFDYGDIAITSRPLSYAIKHHNKIVWFMHHIRYLYDLWDSEINRYKKEKNKLNELRKKVMEYDNKFLRECKKVFSISENVKKRLKKYNNIDSEVLYPPVTNFEKFKNEGYEDYFFFPSRIAINKRQHIAVEALKYTKKDYKLILAGQIDEKYFNRKIKPLLKDPEINRKVEILGYIPEEKKIELYSRCLAVLFTPFDEDYGYITIESFYSSKMVIATTDSGGPLEFIKDGYNGIITNPDPVSIAKTMDWIFENKHKAIEMGNNSKHYILTKNLSWTEVISKLVPPNFFEKFINQIKNIMVSRERD